MRAVALCALLLSWCELAHAQDMDPPSIPPGDDVIEPLAARQPAPMSGMLLDTNTSIRWANRLVWYREALRLRISEQARVVEALTASCTTRLQLVEDSRAREIDGLRADVRAAVSRYEQELTRYRNPPFYEEWGFAFAVGVLAAGLLVGIVGGLVASL